MGNFPQFRGFCMQNYYSDENFTKHLAKPPHEDQAAALQHYAKIFAAPAVLGRPSLDSFADQTSHRGERDSAPR